MKKILGFLLDLLCLVVFVTLVWFVFSQFKDVLKENPLENNIPLQQPQQHRIQQKQHKQQPVKKNTSGKMITAPLGSPNS